MEVSTESERTMEVSTESELFRTTLHEVEASFDIEYGGFLSNHFLHGLVAVARLGADEARFKAFVEAYKQHTVLGHELEEAKPPTCVVDGSNWKDFLRNKSHYVEYREFFSRELKEKGRGHVVNRFVPEVFEHFSGAALHPLIHLGFGLEIEGDDTGVAGGLAYLCYTPPAVSFELQSDGSVKDTDDVFELLVALSEDDSVPRPPYPDSFQKRLSHAPTPRSRAYVQAWRVMQLTEDGGEAKFQHAIEALVRTVVTAFLLTNSDFFVLHGVTSLFALLRVLPLVDDLGTRIRMLQLYWDVFVHVYIAQGKPPVSMDLLSVRCDLSWQELKQRALDLTNDEHTLKIVFVCHEFEKEFGREEGDPLWKTAAALTRHFLESRPLWDPPAL